MFKSEIIELTPELAAKFLQNNNLNRPVSKATLTRYENTIRRGEWKLNGEPIIVFKNNDLGEGQHRCLAVVSTGISIQTVIIYGIDENAFETINTGKNRSPSDVLSMNNEVNCRVLASAARSYLITKLVGREIHCITNLQISECVKDHPHLRYWSQKYAGNKKSKLFPSSICGYLAIASEKYGFEKLDVFFDRLCNGTDLTQGEPAFVLRERFISQTKVSRISEAYARAFIIKSINAHLLGKKISFLRFVESEPMPKVI